MAAASPAPAVADPVVLPEVLRWANDAEGGAPYIFHPADRPDQLVGFEVELAEALCARLGCRSRFVQYNWANLIPGLRQGGNYDLILADRPGLRRAGPPFEPSHYAIAVPLGATGLLARIDEALGQLIADGTLRRIYGRYGLWDETQAGLAAWTPGIDEGRAVSSPTDGNASSPERPKAGFGSAWRYLPILLEAAVTTLWVTLASMALAVAGGLALALARCHGPWLLRLLAVAYIEVFRGTPLLLQLYVIYFGLAQALGWRLSAGVAAVLTLGLNYAANEAENLRAGLEAVPRGQTEAALALGLSPALTLRRVLLPQALRISLPGMTNDLIALFKDSSIVSVIGLVELTKEFLIRSLDAGDYVGLGLLTAAIYLAMGHAASRAARALERRLRA
jgi:polar amino acid transport system substrate-binding protein